QARRVAELLELVEEQDDVVGVHAEGVRERLLGAGIVIPDVRQRDEMAEVHTQKLLVTTTVELLGQTRHQHHRAGPAPTPSSHVLKCTCHCYICHQHSSDHKFFVDNP